MLVWCTRESRWTLRMVVPVDEYSAGGRFVESQQERDKGSLAGASGADDRDGLAGLHGQVYVLDHRDSGLVLEAHTLEADLSPDGRHLGSAGWV